jgi:hypothetical protein
MRKGFMKRLNIENYHYGQTMIITGFFHGGFSDS